MKLTPSQIKRAIESAPPFQKPQVAQNYKGVSVEWEVTFHGILLTSNDEYTVTSLDANNDYPWIYGSADINKYPEFKFINEKQKIFIKGIIKEVTSVHVIHLENCEFKFDGPFNKETDDKIKNMYQISKSQVHFGKGDINGTVQNTATVRSNAWYQLWWVKGIGSLLLMILSAGAIYWFGWN